MHYYAHVQDSPDIRVAHADRVKSLGLDFFFHVIAFRIAERARDRGKQKAKNVVPGSRCSGHPHALNTPQGHDASREHSSRSRNSSSAYPHALASAAKQGWR